MKKVIIHPKDPSTEFLKVLYENKTDYTLYTQDDNNRTIQKALQEAKEVWLLGHGCEYGLLSLVNNKGRDERFIISSRHVEFLRGKKVLGIFCNANMFSEKYRLSGIFSGMVISEMEEALQWNIKTTEEELEKMNEKFARDLKTVLDTNYFSFNIPNEFAKLESNPGTDLTHFNWNSLYHYF